LSLYSLENAQRLLAWMRENGVVSARVGDVALTLGPPPAEPFVEADGPKPETMRYADPLDDPMTFGGAVPEFFPAKGDT
jgi:hypothetical protein